LKNSTGVIKGSRKFNGITSGSLLENSMCIIETSQPFYWYREVEETRTIFTKFFNNGITSNERLYDLDTSMITSVTCYPLEDTYITVSGINVNRLNDRVGLYSTIVVNRNRVRLEKIVFSNALGVSGPRGQISLVRTCDTVVSDVTGTVTEEAPNYSLYYGQSVNILFIRVKSDGDGWGATGSNSCSGVTFIDCDLSRIDAHRPLFNDLVVSNCHIGAFGLTLSIIGDVYITGSSISRGPGNFIGCISSRVDTTGFCDGNITLERVRITGTEPNTTGNDDVIFRKQGDNLATSPAGSPIKQVFWNKITINNCQITSPQSRFIKSTSGPSIQFPAEIIINNTKLTSGYTSQWEVGTFLANTQNSESSYTSRISLTNVEAGGIQLFSLANMDHRFLFTASGIYSATKSGFSIDTVYGGDYLINNSVISSIDTYNGSWAVDPIRVKLSNGKFIPSSDAAVNDGYFKMKNNADVSFCGVDLMYKSAEQESFFNGLTNKILSPTVPF
jgi:hypothetical protein